MLKKAAPLAASLLLATPAGLGCRPEVMSDSPATVQITAADVEAEVFALHAAFVRWFRADVPRTPAGMREVTDALAPGFEIVMPGGQLADREATLAGIEGAYGGWSSGDTIDIRNVRLHRSSAEIVLASYEEWQVRSGETRGRLSTVAFVIDETPAGGMRWFRVHETWLPTAAGG